MALRIDLLGLSWRGGLLGLALLVGLIAGLAPELAVFAAFGVAFGLLAFTDLRAGLAVFVVVIFLETTQVAPGLGLAKLAGGVLAMSWIARVVTDPGSRRLVWEDHPALIAALLGFLSWAALSAAWAPAPAESIDSAFRFLLNAALIPIVYTAVRTTSDLRLVVGAFVIGATLSAILGIASPPSTEGDLARITGTIGDPNELAATLAAGFVLAVGASVGAPRTSAARLALGVAAALCLLAVFLTLSRGGLLALLAIVLLAPALARNRARAAAVAATFLIAVTAAFALLAPPEAQERVEARDGGSGRTDIWRVANRMISDRPVFGVGGGNFQTASGDYVLQPGSLSEKQALSFEPAVAHSIYLETWAELGLVGLLLFLAVLAGCLGNAVTASRRAAASGDTGLMALAGALALALVALFTAYAFLSEQHGNKLWLLLALAPAAVTIASSPRRSQLDEESGAKGDATR